MPESPPELIYFPSAAAAGYLVAGIPAAARALATLNHDAKAVDTVLIAVPGDWAPGGYCLEEAQRLAPQMQWRAVDSSDVEDGLWLDGASLQIPDCAHVVSDRSVSDRAETCDIPLLEAASRQIILSTGKPADGIVSRYLNRPVSQFFSRILLRQPWTRPGHATALAALLGIAMVAALVLGGEEGLLIGAILFQCASIVDGVDGEMARATFRSSERGAMLDSLTDTATNLGFLAGVSYNVWGQGMVQAAIAGALGFAVLAVGSTILGIEARRAGGPFTFDALKHRFRAKPSLVKQALTYITMRDFYALAACLAIIVGAVQPLLFVFAAVACGWFCVVLFVFASSRLSHREP